MAKPLNNTAITGLIGGLSVLLFAVGAKAENLPDPTRPPASITRTEEPGGMDAGTAPILQSVLISGQRTSAVISGQTVKMGDRFGGATVVKIAESEVVLRSGNGLQVLKLFPGIDKQHPSNRAGAKAEAKR